MEASIAPRSRKVDVCRIRPTAQRPAPKLTGHYWETLHIDLRMVDTADFLVALLSDQRVQRRNRPRDRVARLERKPVLFVSPPSSFPPTTRSGGHLKKDRVGRAARAAPHRSSDQAQSERHSQPVVHAAGRRREFLRRLRLPAAGISQGAAGRHQLDKVEKRRPGTAAAARLRSSTGSCPEMGQQAQEIRAQRRLAAVGHPRPQGRGTPWRKRGHARQGVLQAGPPRDPSFPQQAHVVARDAQQHSRGAPRAPAPLSSRRWVPSDAGWRSAAKAALPISAATPIGTANRCATTTITTMARSSASATTATPPKTICRAARDSPKAVALGRRAAPLHDRRRGRCRTAGRSWRGPVGPAEYVDIWREVCRPGLDLHEYRQPGTSLAVLPTALVITIADGDMDDALREARDRLAAAFKPFLQDAEQKAPGAPGVRRIHHRSRRAPAERKASCWPVEYVGRPESPIPSVHHFGFNVRIGWGRRGRMPRSEGIDLARPSASRRWASMAWCARKPIEPSRSPA